MALRFAPVALAMLAISVGGSEPTTVVHTTAWLKGGRLAPGLAVVETLAGYCSSQARSTRRPYSWRCFGGLYYLDPCFSAREHSQTVVCPTTPWTPSVRVIDLTRRLPRWRQLPAVTKAPWGIWTVNRKRCVLAVAGGSLRLAGKPVRYVCQGSGFLVGYASVGNRLWTIGYVPRYDLGRPRIHVRQIGITDVWR